MVRMYFPQRLGSSVPLRPKTYPNWGSGTQSVNLSLLFLSGRNEFRSRPRLMAGRNYCGELAGRERRFICSYG